MPLAFKGYQIRKHVFSFIGKTKMLAYIVHTADHERHNSDKGIVYRVRSRITHQTQFFCNNQTNKIRSVKETLGMCVHAR